MRKLLLLLAVIFCTASAHAQSSAGLIDPSRAMDWTTAGVPGGIPSGTWTQCGPTIAAYTGTADTINQALAHTSAGYTGCAANTYVLLGPGTFTINSGGSPSGFQIKKNNDVLRGSGADQTFVIFGTGTASAGCGIGAAMCIGNYLGATFTSDGAATITAFGTNTITLSVTGAWNSTTTYTKGQVVSYGGNLYLNQYYGSNLNNTPATNQHYIPWTILDTNTMVGIDQCSAGNSGSPCSVNAETDNGNWFDCDVKYIVASGLGCADNGPDGGNQRTNRPQNELFQISSVNAATGVVTLSGNIVLPNWNVANTPQMFAAGAPTQYSGYENFSVDVSVANAYAVLPSYAMNSWVKGLRIIKFSQGGIYPYFAVNNSFVDNYFFSTSHAAQTDSFAMYGTATGKNLWQNNIAQGMQVFMGTEGSDTGSVYGYNYGIGSLALSSGTGDWIYAHSFQHARDSMQLMEGNIINSVYAENLHGPKLANTYFRNFLTGWESCANATQLCGSALHKYVVPGNGGGFTVPLRLVHHSRFSNVIGNVLGTPGIHTVYQTTTKGSSGGYVYEIGTPNLAPTDAVVANTTYRYGNVDVITGVTTPRWCLDSSSTNWASCGGVSEVPTTFSPYGQPAPTVGDTTRSGGAQTALPNSLYLAAKPSWFGSAPWPLIGPDVSGGTIGQCNGTFGPSVNNVAGQYGGVAAIAGKCTGTSLNLSAWGGHVNANPAMLCALNTMGMPPDGSNSSALTFNANTCYSGASLPAVSLTTFPANFGSHTVGVASGSQTFTLTNTGSATLTYTGISVTGTNSANFVVSAGTCVLGGSTLVASASCTVTVVFTPSAPGARTANLQVLSNATSSPDLGAMTGTGQASTTGTGSNFSLQGMLWKDSTTGALVASACRSCGMNCFNCPKPGLMNPSPKIILW